ncbi:hypothetical protein [Kitasatospora phosalacinea]|uniref:Uncharacterized protein n=1 Tax=Kitasatospora phosalacinea TaxID=2065 RepID=A0ABW6GRG3_9ACTN
MSVWHHDNLTVDGIPYTTRYPVPRHLRTGQTTAAEDALGLTEDQMLASTAVHELGHALVWLAGGLHISHISLVPEGSSTGLVKAHLHHTDAETRPLVLGAAAGERASDRWLRETGLWTPGRAAIVEVGARGDRNFVLDHITPRPVFGTGDPGDVDYSVLQDMADAELDLLWDRLMCALPLLLQHRILTGDQLAQHVGLP